MCTETKARWHRSRWWRHTLTWSLLVTGWCVQPGAVAGNPWGLPADGEGLHQAGGSADLAQGYPAPLGGAPRQSSDPAAVPGRVGPGSYQWPTGPVPSVMETPANRWPSQSPTPPAVPSAAEDWDHRRGPGRYGHPGVGRADAPPARQDVLPPVESIGEPEVDASAPGDPGYRFRGDPAAQAGAWPAPAADGRYRFRPLSDQEHGRRERGSAWRPVPPTGPGRAAGSLPANSPAAARGWEPDPWPPR